MAEQKDIGLAALLAQVRLEIDRAQDNLRKSNKTAALDWESEIGRASCRERV